MLCEPLEDFKVVGETLASATWIGNGDRNISTCCKREGHGHSVVVVCVDRCHMYFLWGIDYAEIRAFFYICSQL